MLEKNKHIDDADFNKLIEEAISEDTKVILSSDFTAKVSAKAIHALNYRKKVKSMLVYFCILFVITIIPLSFISIFNVDILLSYKDVFVQNKWIILFTIFLFAGIQIADYLFVKKPENILYE